MIRFKWLVDKKILFCALFLLLCQVGYSLLPTIPEQLTMVDQQKNKYFSTCPQFVSMETSHVIPQTFQLLNWNIYKQQNKQWSEALNDWVKQADLITLQEAKQSQALIAFSEQHQLHFLQNIAFNHKGNNFGVNTLSRIQPQQICGTRYAEPWSVIPKTGLATTYRIKDSKQTLLVINLHAVNFTFTVSPLMEQVTPYLNIIRHHEGPIIVSGDFNTWSDARTAGLIPSFEAMDFKEVTFTEDHRMTVFGLPLDHVFYRGLTLINGRSIATDASDHSPQLVTFSLL